MFNGRNFYNVCKVRRKKMHSLVIEPLNFFAHHSNCYSLELFSQQVLLYLLKGGINWKH